MTSAEFTNTIIPARNRRQAMDWGLVLASQGIEPVIEQSEHGWILLVEPGDYARAQATLRQYQRENRGWGWRQELPWPEITFHWGESEEHTSELQSRLHLVCRLLLEKKKKNEPRARVFCVTDDVHIDLLCALTA